MKSEVINTNNAPIPTGPYVQAINTQNMIFISGQLPIYPNTNIIPNNIYDQTYQALQNILNIIDTINLKIENIIKTTLFLINIDDLPDVNNSYKKFFYTHSVGKKMHLPARSCVEVSRLPKNANIEIEAIAIKPTN
ncbi:Rid family detoxifying hydrolase [Candidatus Blochmannia ocreatus (nom. nud.)]|uniref:Rid family detoxifying hydrolase n=1 Tax=Candidatus Blochmannia ocreatus (nom. nud.) TaxID=251538 RepID=A0ABY4SVM8_9ENTR|nr:Rid family detoxifying hydrolase [Candidatus Blochmannia ocreatus]URJ25123.1 Rid family detoxifying hydrolase [Candidatus Blochmannia ocreatus]